MPVHDAYPRKTPYELSFPDREWAEERFAEIEEEAEARGSDLGDPEAFVMLMSVGKALRELRGPDDAAERIQEHGAVFYHAYHMNRAGEPLYLLDARAARYLVESSPEAGGWTPVTPEPAGYVQFPQHLFWTAGGPEEGERPESLDGFFWVRHGESLVLLVAMGILPGRPGLSVMPLPPVPWAEAAEWTRTDVRPGGEDFASDMPGAELESLYQVRTAGEVLKLVARTFWHLDTSSGATARERPRRETQETQGTREGAGPAAGPEPSALSWTRITLD